MKLNERVKESFYKMVSLNIPTEKRREYLEDAYSIVGTSIFLENILNTKLDELSENRITSEKAVSDIEKMFKDIALNIKEYSLTRI